MDFIFGYIKLIIICAVWPSYNNNNHTVFIFLIRARSVHII